MSELEVVAYDPDWPRAFARERERLRAALPDVLVDIQHIGSTAVPGLAAKPVIDIMASVATLDRARAAVGRVETLGYRYTDVGFPDRLFFERDTDGRRSHHLHLVERSTLAQRKEIVFRDYLRASPQACERYAAVKRALAGRHTDATAYTLGKTEVILELVNEARAAAGLPPLDDVWEGERPT